LKLEVEFEWRDYQVIAKADFHRGDFYNDDELVDLDLKIYPDKVDEDTYGLIESVAIGKLVTEAERRKHGYE